MNTEALNGLQRNAIVRSADAIPPLEHNNAARR